jgi:type 1 fimbria pilin
VKRTNRLKGKTMNCQLLSPRFCAAVLSVMLVLSASVAQAQNGVLEIHGVITSPGCAVNTQTAAQWSQQTSIKGQACGLTRSAANPMSNLNIAHIDQQTLPTSTSTAGKQLVTITYR